MTHTTNRQWILAKRPIGLPDDGTFKLVEEPLPDLRDGEARVKVEHFSVDPGSRPGLSRDSYIPAHPLNTVMMSAGIGTVVDSRDPNVAEGDFVSGALGWQQYATQKANRFVKLDRAVFQGGVRDR